MHFLSTDGASASRLLQQVALKHTGLTLVSGPAVLRLVVGRYAALYLGETDRLKSQCATCDLGIFFFDDTGRDGEFSFAVNESPWLGFVSPLGFKEKPFIVPCEVGKGH